MKSEYNPKLMRELTLNKGNEKYIFRYKIGQEEELIDSLINSAKDKRTDFNEFDAAILSFRLTQRLIDESLDDNSKKQERKNN